MRWDIILKQENWQNLMESMIEEHTYQFGWKSIRDRLVYLRSEYGLNIDIPSDELLVIDEAEKTRHIVIHNGGKVSHEYIARTGKTDVQVGGLIPVTSNETNQISSTVQIIGSDVYLAIAQKFFKAQKEELTGVLHRQITTRKSRQSTKR